MFDRPIPMKPGVANATAKVGVAKPGMGGAKSGGGGGGKATPKGNRFEKKIEFQDPATFSGQEVGEVRSTKCVSLILFLQATAC